MRIFHLISYSLYSGPLPGALALAMAQRQAGHRVFWAYDARRGDFDGFEEAADAEVAHSGLAPPPGLHLALSTKAGFYRHVTDWLALRRVFAGGGIDVVHTHLSHDLVLVRLALASLSRRRRRRVRHVHSAHAALATRRVGRRWLLGGVDRLIVRCEAHRRQLRAFGAIAIPGSVDAPAWCREMHAAAGAHLRTQLGIPAGALVVGLVALMARRGQEQLVAACTMLAQRNAAADRDPPVHVLLVGDGPRRAALQRWAQTNTIGAQVHFAGYLPRRRLAAAYAAMDAAVVLVPGKGPEARSLLEAMASALPTFAPITKPVVADLIDPTCGYPLPNGDAPALAEALQVWLADREAGRRRGHTAAGRMARERCIDMEARATLAFYATP